MLAACGGGDDEPVALADHTVYTMTNASTGNEVLAFRRGTDGMLTRINAYATGGNGLGSAEISPVTPQDGADVLASQGSVQMTPDKRTLVVVNTASATVTTFSINRDGVLTRVSIQPSGGCSRMPWRSAIRWSTCRTWALPATATHPISAASSSAPTAR